VPDSVLKKDNILFLIYSNFGKKFIEKYSKIDKIKHDIVKKIILIPEIKIKTDQLKKTNKVCPISGCAASNKAINRVIKKVDKYLKYIFAYFSLLKITLIKIIKKGLTRSMG
jgi:hypothetical protein